MCRTSVAAAFVICAAFAGPLRPRPALAAESEPEPPVTPFLDSGNDLPDLEARERAERDKRPRPRLGKWYGWEILGADLATAGFAAALDQPVFLAPYVFTGPAIHMAHGRRGLAGISIGIRLALPLWGAVIAKSFANCPESKSTPQMTSTHFDGATVTPDLRGFDALCGLDKAATGALIGAAIAAVADAAIGFTRLPPAADPGAGASQARRIAPRLSVGPSAVSVGLGAAF